jgi:hypothetical protein
VSPPHEAQRCQEQRDEQREQQPSGQYAPPDLALETLALLNAHPDDLRVDLALECALLIAHERSPPV